VSIPTTTVEVTEAPPVRATSTDTTRAFVAAEAAVGPIDDVLHIRGVRDLMRKIPRSGASIPAYDVIDALLREGVPEVYFSRIVGAAPVYASVNLDGPSAGAPYSLTVTANDPGDFANGATGGYKIAVTSPGGGSNRQLVLTYDGDTVATSAVFTSRSDALLFNDLQDYVTVALGAENALPAVVGATNLTGGDADSDGVTVTEVRAALDRFPDDLGSGFVLIPGRTTVESSTELLEHALASGRTALVEAADGLTAGDYVTLATALRALGTGADGVSRMGGLWAQNAIIPGASGSGTREVPWTAIIAGCVARLEATEGHPNVAPFGDYGVPAYATGATRYFSADDAETLFDAGVNVVQKFQSFPRNSSFRSLDDPDTSQWADLAHTRTMNAMVADAKSVGRSMGSRVITRATINEFGARLRELLEHKYFKRGAVYGDTPEQAFRVDTDSVNDVESIAAREVNVAIGAVLSEHAEQVNITIAKVPIGQEV
jgi:hypothetical protein